MRLNRSICHIAASLAVGFVVPSLAWSANHGVVVTQPKKFMSLKGYADAPGTQQASLDTKSKRYYSLDRQSSVQPKRIVINRTSLQSDRVKIIRGKSAQSGADAAQPAATTSSTGNESDDILALFSSAPKAVRGVSESARRILSKMRFSWPVPTATDQYMSSGYGERMNPFGTGRREFHHGIDIACKHGTPVMAALSGTVTEVGNGGGYGNYVRLEHPNGVTTTYGHLSSIQVPEGKYIRTGQLIGTVGSTGRSTGPHLDFSLRIDGQTINPISYMNVPRQLTALR